LKSHHQEHHPATGLVEGWNHALEQWRAIVGNAYVVTAEKEIRRAAGATFKQPNKVVAVVCPGSVAELQQCMVIANRFACPVSVISTGKNWGYGSGAPVSDNCTVIKLSRLAGITGYDKVLGTVSVEPGVTFAQLNAFFKAHGSAHFLNCPGNTADASIVGVTMERGLVPGPRPDMWESIANLTVMLADGTLIHTGHARFGEIRTGKTYRHGLGPSMDGLFTQSNYGIVTEMTLHIDPFPEHFRYLAFSLTRNADFPAIITLIRELKKRRVIGACCTLFNDLRLISFMDHYPWKASKGQTPLPDACRLQIQETLEGGEWYGEIGIEAFNEADGNNKLGEVMRQINPYTDDLYIGEVNEPNAFYNPDMNTGLRSVYWRKKTLPATLDPDSDGCGTIWCVPVVPFIKEDVCLCLDIVRNVLTTHGFEPGITLRFMTTRYLYVMAGIVYDRDVPGEDDKAMACYDALLTALHGHHFLPYRLGIQSMGEKSIFTDHNGPLAKDLKHFFDPNHILSPGRYEFLDET